MIASSNNSGDQVVGVLVCGTECIIASYSGFKFCFTL